MIALRNSTDLRLRVTLSCEWPVAATCKHAINKQAMVSLIIRKNFLYNEIRSKACWFEILFIDTIEGFENLPRLREHPDSTRGSRREIPGGNHEVLFDDSISNSF